MQKFEISVYGIERRVVLHGGSDQSGLEIEVRHVELHRPNQQWNQFSSFFNDEWFQCDVSSFRTGERLRPSHKPMESLMVEGCWYQQQLRISWPLDA